MEIEWEMQRVWWEGRNMYVRGVFVINFIHPFVKLVKIEQPTRRHAPHTYGHIHTCVSSRHERGARRTLVRRDDGRLSFHVSGGHVRVVAIWFVPTHMHVMSESKVVWAPMHVPPMHEHGRVVAAADGTQILNAVVSLAYTQPHQHVWRRLSHNTAHLRPGLERWCAWRRAVHSSHCHRALPPYVSDSLPFDLHTQNYETTKWKITKKNFFDVIYFSLRNITGKINNR